MASDMETAFAEFLLDPAFWRPRLARLARAPRELALFPRPDLARPGVDVVELRLRAHDGARLRGLLVRPSFRREEHEVDLMACSFLGPEDVEWERPLQDGASLLLYERIGGRRLQDRVLDLLRFAQVACEMEAVNCRGLTFRHPADGASGDDVAIAERIRGKGWVG